MPERIRRKLNQIHRGHISVDKRFMIVSSHAFIAFGPSLPVTNPNLDTSSAVIAYARVLDLWGMSAKFDATVPYTWLSGTADFKGQPESRNVNGFAKNPRTRASLSNSWARSSEP